MADYPRRADHFKKWSQLMLEQAQVPERVQYKSNGRSHVKEPLAGVQRKRRRRRKRQGRQGKKE